MREFQNLSLDDFACHCMQGVGNVEALKHFGLDARGTFVKQISDEIKDKAEIIAQLLTSGKHVELCENKDGLRIIAMDRRVVK